MNEELLPFYERELSILRNQAAQFANQHPKIAGRLNLGKNESQDPHVERLLQGVAFLNARLHKRLDDDFPEFTDGLLDLLYPHYLRPVPSMSIVEMLIDPKQAAIVKGHLVPRGSALESERVDGETCLYRTCFDLRLWPLKVTAAKLAGPPFRLPIVPPNATVAVLDIEVETFSQEMPIGKMDLESLRFHLHAGVGQSIYQLYEFLLTRCLGMVISRGPDDADAVVLPPEHLVATGFDPEDAAIPTDPRSFPGYRLLSEMFALPQKFLFVDLQGLPKKVIKRIDAKLYISFLLSTSDRELERVVAPEAIRLGCTPIVNLFEQRLDPMRISGTQSEYCITPDARRPRGIEIHSIQSVMASAPGSKPFTMLPFYAPSGSAYAAGDRKPSSGHPGVINENSALKQQVRWSAMRRPHSEPRPDGAFDGATDVWLSLVNESGGPAEVTDFVCHAQATCTNRNLPTRLPFSVGRPRMTLRDGQGVVSRIVCLTRPTRSLRHMPGRGNAWRIISHLSLNHLSLVDGGNGRASTALRDILGLYLLDDLDDYAQRQRWVQGVIGVSSRRVAARVPGPQAGVAQGLEVKLELDDTQFSDHTAYLFSSVMERFFGSWVTINSFTRMVATSRQQESRKEQWRWPPRAGNRVLA